MIKNVKWFFVVLVFSSFISLSFSGEREMLLEKPAGKVNFPPLQCSLLQSLNLQFPSAEGYTLLSFWASYDAISRQHNAELIHYAEKTDRINWVSVSFDRYQSVFKAAVRQDGLPENRCFMWIPDFGNREELGLEQGGDNYLLDCNGVIVARNVSVDQLSSIMNSGS